MVIMVITTIAMRDPLWASRIQPEVKARSLLIPSTFLWWERGKDSLINCPYWAWVLLTILPKGDMSEKMARPILNLSFYL